MTARVLMVQGASSSAGKSWLVAALCRIFARRGVRVAPFKAQNMSNNAAVCADGSEIGRAQAVQALAAGISPTADMNPILLKPEADARSQVILLGRTWRTLSASQYYRHKAELWPAVTGALDRLRAAHELVIIEGAGSPVELNLKAGDIVNMAVARHARSPVLLVGDIDRGGIFPQLLGTFWLFEAAEQALVRGFVINKFRGDPALFADGVRLLEDRSGVRVVGVIPFSPGLGIPEEDSVVIDSLAASTGEMPGASVIDIAVIALPRISNFDDFDPLAAEPGVQVRYVSSARSLGQPAAVILPGSKSTMSDLAWLREQGLAGAIKALVANGTPVVGICGGYQMLGRSIRDPLHTESPVDAVEGLGLLDTETVFTREKATYQAQARVMNGPGWLAGLSGQIVCGYEIHMGLNEGGPAWLEIVSRNGRRVGVPDGTVSADGLVWGCYLHGLFQNDGLRRAWLNQLGWRSVGADTAPARLFAFDRLADIVEAALDMPHIESLLASQTCQENETVIQ